MTIFTCEHEWDAMLTCIYEAFNSKLGHQNIKLMFEPVEQLTLFDNYIHVDKDEAKVNKMVDTINTHLSPYVYSELAFSSLAYEADVLDNIYHVLILGFAYGKNILDMIKYRDVMRNSEIRKRVGREANRFQEIIRFHQINDLYIAHIDPKSKVLAYLGPVFMDRMPSENFVIVDDTNLEMVVHEKNSDFYIQKITPLELERLKETELINDDYTSLWRVFFNTIAIKERKNIKCQNNHSPLWARTHAVEFQSQ